MNPLLDLTKPFSSTFVRDDGRGNSYVPHHTIIQRIILATGEPPKIEILRELYDEGQLSGVLMRMTVAGFAPVEEFGESDNPQSKTNGARAKDAASDAVKRCAARLGCGLHLWAGETYILHEQLLRRKSEGSERTLEPEPNESGGAVTKGETVPERSVPPDSSPQGDEW